MKRIFSFFIMTVILFSVTVFASSCTDGANKPFETDGINLVDITLENYSLEDIKKLGYVVMENGDVTSGQGMWSAFVSDTEKGKPAFVRCVNYYTLGDKSQYSEEYYGQVKDNYPCAYAYDVTFDGKKYACISCWNGKKRTAEYKYMVKSTGNSIASSALYSSYTRYILTDDKNITWADCERSLLSSDTRDFISFRSVYSDLVMK